MHECQNSRNRNSCQIGILVIGLEKTTLNLNTIFYNNNVKHLQKSCWNAVFSHYIPVDTYVILSTFEKNSNKCQIYLDK